MFKTPAMSFNFWNPSTTVNSVLLAIKSAPPMEVRSEKEMLDNRSFETILRVWPTLLRWGTEIVVRLVSSNDKLAKTVDNNGN